jgi:hypothetical protein
MKSLGLVLAVLIGAGVIGVSLMAAPAEKKEIAIKTVMQEAMKPDGMALCKKVASGQATEEQKARLVELFTALSMLKPKKGEEADWKTRTEALLAAAKDCKAGKEGAMAALAAAADCKGCHTLHK